MFITTLPIFRFVIILRKKTHWKSGIFYCIIIFFYKNKCFQSKSICADCISKYNFLRLHFTKILIVFTIICAINEILFFFKVYRTKKKEIAYSMSVTPSCMITLQNSNVRRIFDTAQAVTGINKCYLNLQTILVTLSKCIRLCPKVLRSCPKVQRYFQQRTLCTFKINCVAKCSCNVFHWKQAMSFYVKKIGIIQVVQNKEDFERSNAPINEGVIPEASYHFQKKKKSKN